MAPRFMERINRQTETLKNVFGDPLAEPPSYASAARSSLASTASASAASTYSTAPTTGTRASPDPPPRYNHSMPQRIELGSVVIAPDSLILVTGANSFLGMHIVDQLLTCGYRVRGTVRDAEKAAWTSKYFASRHGGGRFTTTIVPDMAVKGAFDAAVRECGGVVHVASATFLTPDPNRVVTPSIAGALNLLEAAAAPGSSVVRVVHTSSVAATISHERALRHDVSGHTWNMTDFNVAWAVPPYGDDRILAVRSSAKMQTEAAAWRWVEVNRPRFAFNTVLPDVLWGRLLDPENQSYPISVEILRSIYDGAVPQYPPSHFVDVRNTAMLHVAALLFPDIQKQRIFAVNSPWTVDALLEMMPTLHPQRSIALRRGNTDDDRTFFREAGRAEELLRRMGKKGWTDMQTSIEETCAAFQ